jgi:hypothetical protein
MRLFYLCIDRCVTVAKMRRQEWALMDKGGVREGNCLHERKNTRVIAFLF